MLTKEQQNILQAIKEQKDRVYLITGEAGSGKTHLLVELVKQLQTTKTILVTATTNKAKNNLLEVLDTPCYTTQSALGFLLYSDYIYSTLQDVNEAKKADILIIDEISMLQPQVLEKALREPYKTICLFGDLFQTMSVGKQINFDSLECMRFTLKQQMRQTDESLSTIFKTIRDHIDKKCLIDLEKLQHTSITLYTSHKQFCKAFLEASNSKNILAYTNRVVDSYNLNLNNNKRFSIGDTLILDKKIGQFSNGDRVSVTDIVEKSTYYKLVVNHCQIIYVYKTKEAKQKAIKKLLVQGDTSVQPILNSMCNPKHPYALTIHKATGSTIDNVFVDVTDLYNQATKQITKFSTSPPMKIPEYLRLLYVGLSRMRKTAHLYVGNKREYQHLRKKNGRTKKSSV